MFLYRANINEEILCNRVRSLYHCLSHRKDFVFHQGLLIRVCKGEMLLKCVSILWSSNEFFAPFDTFMNHTNLINTIRATRIKGSFNPLSLHIKKPHMKWSFFMERETRLELATSSLARKHSTTELPPHICDTSL